MPTPSTRLGFLGGSLITLRSSLARFSESCKFEGIEPFGNQSHRPSPTGTTVKLERLVSPFLYQGNLKVPKPTLYTYMMR